MKKILLVFYSRTGFTRKLARDIAAACPCEIEEIQDVRSREGFLGYLRTVFEGWTGRAPAIKEMTKDPGEYDLVILGSPIWFSKIATPLRTYVKRHHRKFNNLAFFCTCGGALGAEKAVQGLADLSNRKPIASLIVLQSELSEGVGSSFTGEHEKIVGRYREKLDEFVKRITA